MELLFILVLAAALDLAVGGAPRAIHPVGWMGKVIAFLTKGGKDYGPPAQFCYGMGVVLVSSALFTVPTYFLLRYLHNLHPIVFVAVGAVLFKTTFSLRELRQSAFAIRNLLARDKLPEARFALRALVGRDTPHLDDTPV